MSIPDSQRAVAAHLQALAGRPPIETHISAVFVGADTVWKLKKAVRLSFVDFSTLERRHRFLLRELALNQPHAPDLYRDVVPVGRRPDGSLTLHDGEPVDWVLRMAPVPAADFLDAVADRGALTPLLQDRLGDAVAAAHDRLPPVTGCDSAGRMAAIAEGNAVAALAAGLPKARVRAWQAAILAEVAALRPWLAARAAAGLVRRCHGDLHLGNLCLWGGVPVPFDALEFDEALATIDTGYDLAFLLMDLDLRVGRAAANRVMNRYLARTGDVDLVRGLPLFLSQRAMIRAHVQAAQGRAAPADRLLAAAEAYLRPAPAPVLAIGGLQGTGKSTLARLLAPELGRAPGAVIVRSDEIRKRLFGKAPEARLPPDAYTEAANARVNRALVDTVQVAAASGQAVIADSTFLNPAMAPDLTRALAGACTGIWLDAPLSELERRVAARHDDASDATVAVLRQAAARATPPAGWTVVDATDLQAAAAAVRALTAA